LGTEPSQFRFVRRAPHEIADQALAVERVTHGQVDQAWVPKEEGRRRLRLHVEYERNAANRARAIAIHGTSCLACGFDFDSVYGHSFARSYIEIHHIRPLADQEGPVNPATDLIPLCANCHSMAHREPAHVLSLQELRALLEKGRHDT
jgi:5-methylcytosine-specific restriction protein A